MVLINYPNKAPKSHMMNRIPRPTINIWKSIYPHPMPPARAPPTAPAPRSPSFEPKKPIAAPIIIAIISTVNHINNNNFELTNPQRSAINRSKETWDYCLLSPQRSWNYLSANNEAIAHVLRYIIPINGYNNPKREHIAITLAD